jgi:GrpB-like predicted nucleotidyltransferase (UPF0157 family)
MENHEEKLARVLRDRVEVVPYDPAWPALFEEERRHLLACLPQELILRIEHFGSTSVPGLAAKPVIDLLIEVRSLDEVRRRVAPVLEAQGYDYFWRPTHGDDTPPWYAWFIKRDAAGDRTHHLHMIGTGPEFSGHRDRLLFRDYLIARPDLAEEYGRLKRSLSGSEPDRVAYTRAKGEFIERLTGEARKFCENRR